MYSKLYFRNKKEYVSLKKGGMEFTEVKRRKTTTTQKIKMLIHFPIISDRSMLTKFQNILNSILSSISEDLFGNINSTDTDFYINIYEDEKKFLHYSLHHPSTSKDLTAVKDLSHIKFESEPIININIAINFEDNKVISFSGDFSELDDKRKIISIEIIKFLNTSIVPIISSTKSIYKSSDYFLKFSCNDSDIKLDLETTTININDKMKSLEHLLNEKNNFLLTLLLTFYNFYN